MSPYPQEGNGFQQVITTPLRAELSLDLGEAIMDRKGRETGKEKSCGGDEGLLKCFDTEEQKMGHRCLNKRVEKQTVAIFMCLSDPSPFFPLFDSHS